ncbi:MAG: hypothetical protein ACRC9K_17480 [Afipia sp.]
MKDVKRRHGRDAPRDAKSRHEENDRSWLANALINSVSAKSTGRDLCPNRPAVRAPAVVRYFGRMRRAERCSTFALIVHAMFLSAVCLIAIWFSESDAQARCGQSKMAGGQCIDNRPATETQTQRQLKRSDP